MKFLWMEGIKIEVGLLKCTQTKYNVYRKTNGKNNIHYL